MEQEHSVMEYTTDHYHGSEHRMVHKWKNGISLMVNFATMTAYSFRHGEPKNTFSIASMDIKDYEDILRQHQRMDDSIKDLWKEEN